MFRMVSFLGQFHLTKVKITTIRVDRSAKHNKTAPQFLATEGCVMWNNAKDIRSGVTAEEVRELFTYEPESGCLRWKVKRQKINVGDVAGYISTSDGYRYVGFNYNEFLAHRIIWLWVTGKWPACQVDHVDRNRQNNKWTNLREATNGQNARNSGPQKNSRTGIRGVDIRRGKYRVRINVDGKEIVVGRFLDLQDAINARKSAEKEYW